MTEDGPSTIDPRRSLASMRLYRIAQRWNQPEVADIAQATRAALARSGMLARISSGDEVALTAGSRGIASLVPVLRATIAVLRELDARPFIVPAMGSHGGGTADGQRELLASLGVTEASMGVPVRSSMEVVQIGETPSGVPVYADAQAARAQGIILVNRVKKHTNFDGAYESGLAKMAVIGLGKHRQAVIAHQRGNAGLRDAVPEMARVALARAPILGGLAIIENAGGGLADLVGLAADRILADEPALLARAKELSAKIPFRSLDICLVERMGKEISGTGMDCYVIGRRRIIGEAEWPEAPTIRSLVLLDITEASHGNGLGVGLADFCTERLVRQIDWRITRANILTSGNLERGKVPLTYPTDREALEAASFRERALPVDRLRFAAVPDTLHLRELLVSEALAEEAAGRDDLTVVEGPFPLPIDEAGRWRGTWSTPQAPASVSAPQDQ
jgi:antitoxin (DNA-binding transcriptional repressor) of toxin-antitoxin stability system